MEGLVDEPYLGGYHVWNEGHFSARVQQFFTDAEFAERRRLGENVTKIEVKQFKLNVERQNGRAAVRLFFSEMWEVEF